MFAWTVHLYTQDIFLPLQGLLKGEDTNTNMITRAAVHRLIFKKKKKKYKTNKGCARRRQLQSYSHTFGQQRNCCQKNVVALDTGVGTYLLFMLHLIQTAVEWVSDKLCVAISIFNSSTSPALMSDIGYAAAPSSCGSVPVCLSHPAEAVYVNRFYLISFWNLVFTTVWRKSIPKYQSYII